MFWLRCKLALLREHMWFWLSCVLSSEFCLMRAAKANEDYRRAWHHHMAEMRNK